MILIVKEIYIIQGIVIGYLDNYSNVEIPWVLLILLYFCDIFIDGKEVNIKYETKKNLKYVNFIWSLNNKRFLKQENISIEFIL